MKSLNPESSLQRQEFGVRQEQHVCVGQPGSTGASGRPALPLSSRGRRTFTPKPGQERALSPRPIRRANQTIWLGCVFWANRFARALLSDGASGSATEGAPGPFISEFEGATNRPLRPGAKVWPCGSPPRCSRPSPGHSGSSLGSSAFLQTFIRTLHMLRSTRKRWLPWDPSQSQ